MNRKKNLDEIVNLPDVRSKMKKSLDKKYIIDAHTGCWNWTRAVHGGGYGGFSYGGTVLAHRASYVIHKGPIGDKCVLHSCDNKRCVNPDHLSLGTKGDNNREAYARGLQTTLRGEEAGNSKLTKKQVLKIREMYSEGYGYKSLSEDFNTSESNIHAILSRKTWHHI